MEKAAGGEGNVGMVAVWQVRSSKVVHVKEARAALKGGGTCLYGAGGGSARHGGKRRKGRYKKRKKEGKGYEEGGIYGEKARSRRGSSVQKKGNGGRKMANERMVVVVGRTGAGQARAQEPSGSARMAGKGGSRRVYRKRAAWMRACACRRRQQRGKRWKGGAARGRSAGGKGEKEKEGW